MGVELAAQLGDLAAHTLQICRGRCACGEALQLLDLLLELIDFVLALAVVHGLQPTTSTASGPHISRTEVSNFSSGLTRCCERSVAAEPSGLSRSKAMRQGPGERTNSSFKRSSVYSSIE